VVDDTGGLITAAILDRMGAEGRILVFTENDSPPAWGVLGVMNFGEKELSCIKWINWMAADEEYLKRTRCVRFECRAQVPQLLRRMRTTCRQWPFRRQSLEIGDTTYKSASSMRLGMSSI